MPARYAPNAAPPRRKKVPVRSFTLILFCLCTLMPLAANGRSTTAAPRLLRRSLPRAARVGGPVPHPPQPGDPARYGPAALGASPSPRLSLRQRKRRLDPLEVQRVGPRRSHRDLRRPLSHAPGAARRAGAPTRFSASLREPSLAVDPTSKQAGRAASHLQRLLRRRGRDGAPRLRQLRHPGRLRTARALRHLRQRRCRHRPLRRLLARHQPKVAAEHGAVGCLIYSDPHEDGYFGGDIYPQGPWRPREGVQRAASWTCRSTPAIP